MVEIWSKYVHLGRPRPTFPDKLDRYISFGNYVISKYICRNCYKELVQAYIFIKKVKTRNKIIESHIEQIENQVKCIEELDSSEFDNAVIVIPDLTIGNIKKFNESINVKSIINCKMKSQTREDLYKCANCEEVFNTKIAVSEHIKMYHNDGGISQKNKHIEKTCVTSKITKMKQKTVVNLKRESKPNNKTLKKLRQCSKCPATFDSMPLLKQHLQKHNQDEKHKCSFCNEEFESKSQYITHSYSWSHIRKSKPDLVFNFKCNDCNFTSRNRDGLEKHQNANHFKVKPYCCYICSKRFTSPLSLKYHIIRHKGLKKFQCNECSNLFTSGSGLKKHILKHHTDKRPFPCEKCDKTFVSPSERNLHTLRSHSEKNINCPLCHLKFHAMANLKNHTKKVHFKTKESFESFMKSDQVSKEFYEMFRDHRLTF